MCSSEVFYKGSNADLDKESEILPPPSLTKITELFTLWYYVNRGDYVNFG